MAQLLGGSISKIGSETFNEYTDRRSSTKAAEAVSGHETNHPAPTNRDTRNDPAGSAAAVQSNLNDHETTHPAPTNRDTRNEAAGTAAGLLASHIESNHSGIEIIASGELSNGQVVVLNTDGTVSYAGEFTTEAGVGNASVFSQGIQNRISVAYDTYASKVVIAYCDASDSYKGKVVVGTITEKNISFGDPVIFNNTNSDNWIALVFDPSTSKIVLGYTDFYSSEHGKALVGTIVGNSIDFGDPVTFSAMKSTNIVGVFDSNAGKIVFAYRTYDGSISNWDAWGIVGEVDGTTINFGTATKFFDDTVSDSTIGFDSNLNKIIVAFSDYQNGYLGKAVVGAVSGHEISFSDPVTFNEAVSSYMSIAFDPVANKFAISFRDGVEPYHGYVVVGTISDTTATFGDPVLFNAATTTYPKIIYSQDLETFAITYRDEGNSNYGTMMQGVISENSMTFEDPFVFAQSSTIYPDPVAISGSNKIAIAYKDFDNSNRGTAIVYEEGGVYSNVDNWFGLSAGAYADGATARIWKIGDIADNLSGLIPGADYYVHEDGSITASAFGSVGKIGTAISTTEMLLIRVDLTDYLTSAQTSALISAILEDYSTTTDIATLLSGYLTPAQAGTLISVYSPIDAPTITAPTAAQTDFEGPFACSDYATDDNFVEAYDATQWQIASDSEFSTVLYDSDATTAYAPTLLHAATTLYVRCRHMSGAFMSPWSDTVTFTTPAAYIQTPSLTLSGSALELEKTPIIYSSAFAVALGGTDTHASTDWQVLDDTDTVVYQSLADTTNKLSLDLDGLVTLDGGSNYTFRCRHNGAALDPSEWAEIEATTIADWVNETIYSDAEITALIADDYIPVSTAAELVQIGSATTGVMTFGFNTEWEMELPSSSSTDRGTYKWLLLSNLDMASQGNFRGLGTYGSFSGTFDGAGMVISNVMQKMDLSYSGFAGYVTGTIKNLGLMNPIITGGYGGGSYGYTGGLVAYLAGTVDNCFVVGGVIEGYQGDTDSVYFTTGGLAAIVISTGTITNCYTMTTVIGSYKTGGFAGRLSNATVTNCYSTGKVLNPETANRYGFCGNYSDTGSLAVTGCALDTDTSNNSDTSENTYITLLTTAQLMASNSPHSGWSGTYWDLGTSQQYPYLVSFGAVSKIDLNTTFEVVGEV